MFGTKTILVVSRSSLKVVNVSLLNKKTTVLLDEKWNKDTLTSLVKTAVDKKVSKKVRLLLDDDSSYVIEGDAPEVTKTASLRSTIKNIVVQQVPEEVEESSWDFKLLDKKVDGKKRFVAFVPVMETYKLVVDAFTKAGFSFEAVEPAQIAEQRHKDAVIGIAMKKDIKGKDSKQLSLDPVNQDTKNNAAETMPLSTLFVMLAILLGILVTIIFVVFFWQNREKKLVTAPENAPASIEEAVVEIEESNKELGVVEEASAEADIEENEDEIDVDQLAKLAVNILNGAGEAGLAGSISDRLQDEGFSDIDAANANNFDYEGISVSFKEDLANSDKILTLIEETFSEYDVGEENNLDAGNQYDIQLIVGAQ